MKYCILAPLFILTSCATLPGLYQAVDDIETDNAVEITITKEAIQKDTNVNINIDVQNVEKK